MACRIIAKAAGSKSVPLKLSPSQFGFGVKKGAVAAAHVARIYLNNFGPRQIPSVRCHRDDILEA